ncbi:hypothetical protein HDU87_007933 [Geranomyces variabilis]|uniref:Uncharacterized protein n=1 Tax=Geranomyces variabilis TaxID=109894 RepID=A0AAD5XJC6_9FUNG|nr:hypothetical protein HDU87_007933 [Geranomyces variabilis]
MSLKGKESAGAVPLRRLATPPAVVPNPQLVAKRKRVDPRSGVPSPTEGLAAAADGTFARSNEDLGVTNGGLSSSPKKRPKLAADEHDPESVKNLKDELSASRNACLKARLDSEHFKSKCQDQSRTIEDLKSKCQDQSKIIEDLKQRLNSANRTRQEAETRVDQLRRELTDEKGFRVKAQERVDKFLKLAHQIDEEKRSPVRSTARVSESRSDNRRDLTVDTSVVLRDLRRTSDERAHPIPRSASSHNQPIRRSLPHSASAPTHDAPKLPDRDRDRDHQVGSRNVRRPSSPRQRSPPRRNRELPVEPKPAEPAVEEEEEDGSDPNASAIIPVDEELWRKAEEEKKLEAMLKVEVRPEALATVTKQSGDKEDFPVDISDAKPILKAVPEKKRGSETKWYLEHRHNQRLSVSGPGQTPGGTMLMHHGAQRYSQGLVPYELEEARIQAMYGPYGHPQDMGFYPPMMDPFAPRMTMGMALPPPPHMLPQSPMDTSPTELSMVPFAPAVGRQRTRTNSVPFETRLSVPLPRSSIELPAAPAPHRGSVEAHPRHTPLGDSVQASSYRAVMNPHMADPHDAARVTSVVTEEFDEPDVVIKKENVDPPEGAAAASVRGRSAASPSPTIPLSRDCSPGSQQVLIAKATAMLHAVHANTHREERQCVEGTIILKAVPGQPETARIVMYDDWNDHRVLNLMLTDKLAATLHGKEIHISDSDTPDVSYIVTFGSPTQASDLFAAIEVARKREVDTRSLDEFLRAYDPE